MNEGPIAGGATLAAGSGTADGVAYGPRSTEHAWSCHSRCASPSMVMVLALRQTAEERRLGRLMKHEHCAQQTNDRQCEPGPAAGGGGGGREGREGVGCRGLGNLVGVPRCIQVPSHPPEMHPVKDGESTPWRQEDVSNRLTSQKGYIIDLNGLISRYLYF